ncbi:MAG: RnfABCDGE type electron transport complex subunit D [Bacteroidales bacterium]|nr:RnfABCDGE type electron transport complex subunit D [Bacteroidales bacterium]
MNQFIISGSPHVHGPESTRRIMLDVIIALMPALLVALYFFGWYALRLTVISVAACVLTEWLIQKYLLKVPTTVGDLSAVVTGILLAFNVPANLPVWMIIVGAVVSIGIAKMSFGGLGHNPFNPALVGRVFLLVSFPTAMTTWPKVSPIFENGFFADAITGPTPLGLLKESAGNIDKMELLDMLFGNRGGAFGEMCAIALIIGGLYLIIRRVIDVWTPLVIFATVFAFTGICYLIDPATYIAPVYHIFYGGLILGAFFMATDMVTSPMTTCGKCIFAFGIGVITVVIRLWGAYPEGVSFAILIMNALVPLINRGFTPKRFGSKK